MLKKIIISAILLFSFNIQSMVAKNEDNDGNITYEKNYADEYPEIIKCTKYANDEFSGILNIEYTKHEFSLSTEEAKSYFKDMEIAWFKQESVRLSAIIPEKILTGWCTYLNMETIITLLRLADRTVFKETYKWSNESGHISNVYIKHNGNFYVYQENIDLIGYDAPKEDPKQGYERLEKFWMAEEENLEKLN